MQALLIITCDLDLLIEKTMIISTCITLLPPNFLNKGLTIKKRREYKMKKLTYFDPECSFLSVEACYFLKLIPI